MWDTYAASLVVGALLAWIAQQIAKGNPRWRALTVAARELEVASQFPDDDELHQQLTEQARKKVRQYLRRYEPQLQADRLRRALVLLTFIVLFAAGLVVAAVLDTSPWFSVLFGVVVGYAATQVDEWLEKKLKPSSEPTDPEPTTCRKG